MSMAGKRDAHHPNLKIIVGAMILVERQNLTLHNLAVIEFEWHAGGTG